MEEQNQQKIQLPSPQPEKPKKKFYKSWWFFTTILVLIMIGFFINVYANFELRGYPYDCDGSPNCVVQEWTYSINCKLHNGEMYDYFMGGLGKVCGIGRTSDAGNKCLSSSECEGDCVTYTDMVNPNFYQCSKYIEDGRAHFGVYDDLDWEKEGF